jgi:serine/threonine protein kinase
VADALTTPTSTASFIATSSREHPAPGRPRAGADFGIALAAAKTGGSRMTETGMSLGTPQYMSPEQAMGERELDAADRRLRARCITYEMLAGEPPSRARRRRRSWRRC